METFFTPATEPWTEPSGQLHLYVLPDRRTADALEPYRQALVGGPGVAVQPREYLHFTVQRLPHMLRQVRAQVPSLVAAMRQELHSLPSFELHLRQPEILPDSVVVRAAAEEGWRALTERLRAACVRVLGASALTFDPPAIGTHLTLAYGIGHGDDAALAARLGAAAQQSEEVLATLRVDSAILVAVHVDPSAGIYAFDHLAEISFGHD